MAGFKEEKQKNRQCLELYGTDGGVRLMKRKFNFETGDDIGMHMVEPLTRAQIEQRLDQAKQMVADQEEMLRDFDDLQKQHKAAEESRGAGK